MKTTVKTVIETGEDNNENYLQTVKEILNDHPEIPNNGVGIERGFITITNEIEHDGTTGIGSQLDKERNSITNELSRIFPDRFLWTYEDYVELSYSDELEFEMNKLD